MYFNCICGFLHARHNILNKLTAKNRLLDCHTHILVERVICNTCSFTAFVARQQYIMYMYVATTYTCRDLHEFELGSLGIPIQLWHSSSDRELVHRCHCTCRHQGWKQLFSQGTGTCTMTGVLNESYTVHAPPTNVHMHIVLVIWVQTTWGGWLLISTSGWARGACSGLCWVWGTCTCCK